MFVSGLGICMVTAKEIYHANGVNMCPMIAVTAAGMAAVAIPVVIAKDSRREFLNCHSAVEC